MSEERDIEQQGNHELTGEINFPKSPTINTNPEKPESINIDVSRYGEKNQYQDPEIPVFEIITNTPKS